MTLAGPGPGQVVDRLQTAYRDGSVDGMLALYAADATFEDALGAGTFTSSGGQLALTLDSWQPAILVQP